MGGAESRCSLKVLTIKYFDYLARIKSISETARCLFELTPH